MANRILISVDGFKLSRPAQNVLTALDNQLLVNGDYGGAAKFIKGSISGTRTGSGTTTQVVSYGKTFSAEPFVMINCVGGSGSSRPGNAVALRNFGDSANPWGDFASSWTRLEVEVRLSEVEFRFNSAASTVSYTINYMIFDYRMGF